MPSAYNLHPESRYSCLSPKLHHKLGLALAFIAFGSIAAASGVVLQMVGHEPNSNRSSAIAAAPLDPAATHPTSLAAPASPAVSAPKVSPSTPAQAARVAASAVAAPEPAPLTAPEPVISEEPVMSAATESPSPPVAAAKKPKNRAARSQSRRDRGWYDAYAWSPRADYGRARGYRHDFARPTW
jgi:hypothetical protein